MILARPLPLAPSAPVISAAKHRNNERETWGPSAPRTLCGMRTLEDPPRPPSPAHYARTTMTWACSIRWALGGVHSTTPTEDGRVRTAREEAEAPSLKESLVLPPRAAAHRQP